MSRAGKGFKSPLLCKYSQVALIYFCTRAPYIYRCLIFSLPPVANDKALNT
uniref:Uncharacterized protein n=1 Tax=Arundo donax TaxID=35708 RepID=A0A0A9FJL8_ARUDO